MIPLDPQLAKLHCWNKRTSFAWRAGVTGRLRASGPKKPGKSSGESSLSPEDFPGFPRMLCIRVGVQRTPGQKRSGAEPDFYVSLCFCGNRADFTIHVVSAMEVQEMKSPGAGVRGMHLFSDKGLLNPRLQFIFLVQQNSKICNAYNIDI